MSWQQMLSVIEQTAIEEQHRNRRIIACPNDGEPLTLGPNHSLFCKFDGQVYPFLPRDL